MNKSNINELSAGTETDSNSTAENQQVSQPNANTNVVGSLFGQREIKFRYIFKTFDGRFIVECFTLKELEYGGLQNFLFGLHDIIIVAKCQYTGLKDKNGKEIYEGDFLEITNPYNGLPAVGFAFVKFSYEYVGGWVATRDGNGHVNIGTRTNLLRVVGNIFENPELLETLR